MIKIYWNKIKKIEHEMLFDETKDIKNRYLKMFFKSLTILGSSVVILSLLIIIGLVTEPQVLYILIPIYLFQLITVEIIKLVIRRDRPKTYKNTGIFRIKISSGSFPSGHTSNIFSLAFLLSNYFNTSIFNTIILFVIAGLVAASRIFLGKHYFFDVLAGAILGILLTYLGTFIWIQLYTNFQFI